MKKSSFVALVLALLASAGAYAHGDAHSKTVFDAATAEQTDFGIAGDPAKAKRTIKITMGDDMRFTPSTLTVKEGETVKISVTNRPMIESAVSWSDQVRSVSFSVMPLRRETTQKPLSFIQEQNIAPKPMEVKR